MIRPEPLKPNLQIGYMTLIKPYKNYWICKCICGIKKGKLTSIIIKSLAKKNKARLRCSSFCSFYDNKDKTANRFNYLTSRGAIIRKLEYSLTTDQVKSLIFLSCHYCGVEPKQTFPKLLEPYNGLDRIDNNKGYVIDNCVPCCGQCNYMKRSMTYSDFVNRCKQVAMHLNSINKNKDLQ